MALLRNPGGATASMPTFIYGFTKIVNVCVCVLVYIGVCVCVCLCVCVCVRVQHVHPKIIRTKLNCDDFASCTVRKIIYAVRFHNTVYARIFRNTELRILIFNISSGQGTCIQLG